MVYPVGLRRMIVYGTGALGCVLGARLSQVISVDMLVRRKCLENTAPNTPHCIDENHLNLSEQGEVQLLGPDPLCVRSGPNFRWWGSLKELDPPLGHWTHRTSAGRDVILLTVKAGQLEAALHDIRIATPVCVETSVLLVLCQNGTGFEPLLQGLLAEDPRFESLFAVVHRAATREQPRVVVDWGGTIMLPHTGSGASLASRLKEAGMEVELHAEIQLPRWKKIAFNCALNAFSALMDCPNKATILPELRAIRCDLLHEVRQIAALQGITLPGVAELLNELEARMSSSNNVNSMLQDIRSGRPTENPFLNGAIALQAEDCGLPAPANNFLAKWIDRLERCADVEQRCELREEAMRNARSWMVQSS